MRESELIKWMEMQREPDQWWVSVDGRMLEEPLSLGEIHDLDIVPGRSQLRVLHVNAAKMEGDVSGNKAWQDLELEAIRPKMQKPTPDAEERELRWRKIRLIAGITLALALPLPAAYGLLKLGTWWLEQSATEPEDVKVIVSRLTLPAEARKTDRSVLILNRGTDPWQSVRVWINGRPDEGYTYYYDKEVVPGDALNVPFRFFRLPEGRNFDGLTTEVEELWVEVEGYKNWYHRFRE